MNRIVVYSLWLISLVIANGCLANNSDNNATFNTDREPFLLAQTLGKITDITQEGMQRWGVPGLALAIVKDGKVIFIEGFGYRDLEETIEVTPDTHFLLASITKAFTALTMGLLVEDGVIGWDTPVSTLEPGFQLSSPEYTSQVTLRDMLSHRTGIETRDSLWSSGEHSVNEIYERLDELEVISPLRERFEYHNNMYIASALLVEKLIGTDWTDFGRSRLLNPLNMATTGFSTEEFKQSKNYSIGFRMENGTLVANRLAQPEDNAWYTSRGSGSMFSNVREMSNWMLLQLGDGRFEGRRVVSTDILQATHQGQIRLKEPPSYLSFSDITDHAYAMGWYVDNYRGHQRWHHGGATPMGYSNYITLFPDDNIGMVILSNRFVFMPVELMYQISDLLLGLKPEAWNDRFADYLQ